MRKLQRKLTQAEIRRRKRAGAYHDPRKPLTAKRIAALKVKGRYRDGGDFGPTGLYLQVSETGSKSWLLRFEQNGREQWMGLGSARIVGLKDARARAKAERLKLLDGVNPIAERRTKKAASKLAAAKRLTFRESALKYAAQNEAKWKNASHRAQFLSSLDAYAFPTIGAMDVADVDTAAVLRLLEPIWQDKTETASRVRGRIEAVLDWAAVYGHRPRGDNPARWRGHLDQVFPRRGQIAPIEHHAALPYAELPALVARLRGYDGSAARALEFLIHTAARTGEVLGARWDEINFADRTWVIPPSRMKARKEHRVPLSKPVLDLLLDLPREDGNPFLFVGSRAGQGLSRIALGWMLGERMGVDDVTIHGFRSTFRDWAAEQTNFSRDVPERALAHGLRDKTEAAYERTDLFERRRRLMQMWSDFCLSPAKGGDVVGIRRKAAP
jgi:integrase